MATVCGTQLLLMLFRQNRNNKTLIKIFGVNILDDDNNNNRSTISVVFVKKLFITSFLNFKLYIWKTYCEL